MAKNTRFLFYRFLLPISFATIFRLLLLLELFTSQCSIFIWSVVLLTFRLLCSVQFSCFSYDVCHTLTPSRANMNRVYEPNIWFRPWYAGSRSKTNTDDLSLFHRPSTHTSECERTIWRNTLAKECVYVCSASETDMGAQHHFNALFTSHDGIFSYRLFFDLRCWPCFRNNFQWDIFNQLFFIYGLFGAVALCICAFRNDKLIWQSKFKKDKKTITKIAVDGCGFDMEMRLNFKKRQRGNRGWRKGDSDRFSVTNELFIMYTR